MNAPDCPVHPDFDPLSPAHLADPYAAMADLPLADADTDADADAGAAEFVTLRFDPSVPVWRRRGRRTGVIMAALLLLGFLTAATADAAARPAAGGHAAGTGRTYRVLVFTRTAGFRHASIRDGAAAIRRLGRLHGFTVDETADAARFTDAGLRPYAAVVWLSTTGDLLTATQQAAFERYVRAGGGYVGVHAAADAEYGWAWYGGLVGAVFRSHPPIQRATVTDVDRHHPATASLPSRWTRTDEWYDFRAAPGPRVHVLAVDGPTTYPDGHRGGGHPVVWCQDYDGGRSFYVALGHTAESWREPAFLDVVLGGIETASGARPADCAPAGHAAGRATSSDGGTSPALLALAAIAAAVVAATAGLALARRRRHL